ncbi:hypothetical protein ACHAWF_003635, partial [Thalassiosira exigua]
LPLGESFISDAPELIAAPEQTSSLVWEGIHHSSENSEDDTPSPIIDAGQLPILASGVPSTGTKILYVVRSFEGRYESRLSLQARSWMQNLQPENESVMVASQSAPGEGKARLGTMFSTLPSGVKSTFLTPECELNDHGMGLCCQEAHALVAAARKKEFHPFDWAFVIDDDVFVSTSILREVVANYDHSSPVSIGTLGCVSDQVPGFCGGGGYLISRPALEQLVELPNFMSRYMALCKKTMFCDIVTASLLNTANVTTLSDGHFRPWGYHDDKSFSKSPLSNDASDMEIVRRFHR